MTINRASLVIIFATLAAGAAADELTASARLTTTAVAPIGAALTTVVVNGSSVYDAPRLFGAYRGELGKPITRESARAVVEALAGLYVGDGYVRPEIRLDDTLIADGVRHLVLDLRELEFIDSTGLRSVYRVDQLARQDGFNAAVVRGAPAVQRLFDLTGLADQLVFVDSPESLAPPTD